MYIYIILLGGITAVDELQFDNDEHRHLSEQLSNSSLGSTVPYNIGTFAFILLKQYLLLVTLLSFFFFFFFFFFN